MNYESNPQSLQSNTHPSPPNLTELDRTNAFDSYCTHPSKPNLHPENLNQVFVLLHAPFPPISMLRIIRDPRRRYKTNQRAAQTKKQKRINIEIGGPGVLKTTLSEHPLIFLSIYCLGFVGPPFFRELFFMAGRLPLMASCFSGSAL